jgi:hypothetical protein
VVVKVLDGGILKIKDSFVEAKNKSYIYIMKISKDSLIEDIRIKFKEKYKWVIGTYTVEKYLDKYCIDPSTYKFEDKELDDFWEYLIRDYKVNGKFGLPYYFGE